MKKDKSNTIESFLRSEFFDPNQKQSSEELRIVKNYALNAPYSYANILYDEKNSSSGSGVHQPECGGPRHGGDSTRRL